jgi:predicted DNA binding protein
MAIQEPVETITELELQVTDPKCLFVTASEEASCRLTLEHLMQRSDGTLLEFFAVAGADPEEVVELMAGASGVAEARVVAEALDGGLIELVVSGRCVTRTLADVGAVAREVTASEGIGRVVADVPAHVDVRTVVETFRARHPGSELLASRQGTGSVPFRTEQGLKETLAGRLTDRQLEVFRTAYLMGYFEWPRESNAEACAAALDISQPTFSQHLRAVQHEMAECLFGDWPPRRPSGAAGPY